MFVDAVGAQRQQVAAGQVQYRNVGAARGTVADHASRVIRRATGWRRFAELAEGVIARQQLRIARARGGESVHPAIANPGEQPPRRPQVQRRTQRHRCRARRCGRLRDALCDRAVGAEHHAGHELGVERHAGQRHMQVFDELATSELRHRTAADTIGDDEQGRRVIKRTVGVLVVLMLAAAGRRHRGLDAPECAGLDRLLRAGRRRGDAAAITLRCGLQRCAEVRHETQLRHSHLSHHRRREPGDRSGLRAPRRRAPSPARPPSAGACPARAARRRPARRCRHAPTPRHRHRRAP